MPIIMLIMIAFLALQLLAPLSHADDQQGDSMGNYFDTAAANLKQNTGEFVKASGQMPAGVFHTVLDAFGPGQCSDDCMTSSAGTGFIIGTWIVPTVLAMTIVVFGVAVIYMFGQFLNSPQFIAMAKEEGFQTACSFLRVAFIIGMLTTGDLWYSVSAQGIQGDPIYGNSANRCMIDASMAFSRLMVGDMVTNYSMLLMYNMVIHTIYSSTMWFGVTWRAMYSFNLGPILKPLIDIVGSALQFLSMGISEWLLHIVTLCLIKKWTWALFIPLGLLLRALPHTRSAGEALLALAFALAFFYPFMFIFDYEVHKLMQTSITPPEKAVGNFMHNSGLLSIFGPGVVVMLLMGGVFVPFFLGAALSVAFELVRNSVYYIVIMSVFVPFLNIFVTLTAAKETANFFRVDVNFMSFLRII
jgi:hypothetical protein